jgi:Recombination endonuclease VII
MMMAVKRQKGFHGYRDVTFAQFDALLAAQGGVCKICEDTDPGDRDWQIDHDYETGRIRGILCTECSLLVAGADGGDFAEHLIRAGEYLKARGFTATTTNLRLVPKRELKSRSLGFAVGRGAAPVDRKRGIAKQGLGAGKVLKAGLYERTN